MCLYDEFAQDYHWLYSDHVLSGEPIIEENKDVLSLAERGTRILDCSYGIGMLALALARRAFKVVGSDGSKGMIEQAISAAAAAGLKIPLICSTWEELPKHLEHQFDLVFCLGNSICHCRNRDEMLRSFKGMRRVLRNGGKLIINHVIGSIYDEKRSESHIFNGGSAAAGGASPYMPGTSRNSLRLRTQSK